jgi:hypothetical protein
MITLQQLDEAIELYERCLKEKWEYWEILENELGAGLCSFFTEKFNTNELYRLIDIPKGGWYLCPRGDDLHYSHQKRFAPRIVFLKTLREELIKEGYYEINE